MSEIRQKIVKEFPAEMAGERVGWVSTNEIQHEEGRRDLKFAAGYGTVDSEGAQISRLENEDGELYYSDTSSVFGLSRACAWSFYVSSIEGESWDLTGLKYQSDITVSDFPGVMSDNFERRFSGMLSHGTAVHLEDESEASWAVGDTEIVESIKGRLGDKGAASIYSPMYIALNAVAGRYAYCQSKSVRVMSEYLLPDATQSELTAREIELMSNFEMEMRTRAHRGDYVVNTIDLQQLTKNDTRDYDEQTLKIEESFQSYVAGSAIPQPFVYKPTLPRGTRLQPVFENSGVLSVARAVENNTKSLQPWSELAASSLLVLRMLKDAEKATAAN